MKKTLRYLVAGLATALLSSCVRFSIYLPDSAFEPTATRVEPKPAEPRSPARDLTNAMTEELKLAPEQQGRVQEILLTTVQKARAARTLYADNQLTLSAALRRINADSERQLRQALSATQYQQYLSRRPQLQARMQTPAVAPPATGGPTQ